MKLFNKFITTKGRVAVADLFHLKFKSNKISNRRFDHHGLKSSTSLKSLMLLVLLVRLNVIMKLKY